MLLPLRRLLSPLRRSLSTAVSRTAWAMVYQTSTAEESAATRRASVALAPRPLASRVSVPRHAFGLDPLPDTASTDGRPPVNFVSFGAPTRKQGSPLPASSRHNLINVFGSGMLAASGDGLILLGTFRNRARAASIFQHQVPSPAPFEVLDQAYAHSSYSFCTCPE